MKTRGMIGFGAAVSLGAVVWVNSCRPTEPTEDRAARSAVTSQVVKDLQHREDAVRFRAEAYVHRSDDIELVESLTAAVLDPDRSEDREYLAVQLASVGRKAIPALRALASEGSTDVRVAAIRALPYARPRAIHEARFLCAVAFDSRELEFVAGAAAVALCEYGVDAVSVLTEDLDRLRSTPFPLSSLFRNVGAPAAPVLARHLATASDRQLAPLVRALSELGQAGRSALPAVLVKLSDPNAPKPDLVRCVAEIAQDSRDAQAALLSLLSTDLRDPHGALQALGMLRLSTPGRAIPLLRKFVATESERSRLATAYRLLGRATDGHIRAAAETCGEGMSQRGEVGGAAVAAAVRLGVPGAIRYLRRQFDRQQGRDAEHLIRALAREDVSVPDDLVRTIWQLVSSGLLNGTDERVIGWLARRYEPIQDELCVALRSPKFDMAPEWAIEVLEVGGRLDQEDVQLAILEVPDLDSGTDFLSALGRATSVHERVGDQLAARAKSRIGRDRIFLLTLAIWNQRPSMSAVQQLRELARTDEFRFRALNALRHLRSSIPGLQEEMCSLLRHRDRLTRAVAARVLRTQSPLEGQAVAGLDLLARTGTGFDRVSATTALGAAGLASARRTLEVLATCDDYRVRQAACVALLELGADSRALVESFRLGPTLAQVTTLRWILESHSLAAIPAALVDSVRPLTRSSDAELRHLAALVLERRAK